ncbi:hypothetical protein [Streptomyces drozdowiczii]|uniref:hypothetical protein n=1 Tax=Streptomyces drozdowiczii TaxID=202862 RepID=UPI00403CA5E7
MTERPRVHVRATDLCGEAPVALRDSLTSYDLAIDFSWPPEKIVNALTEIFQEAVDTDRWSRRGTGEHDQADDEPPSVRTARHPEDGY